ncbi:MAG: hypothetical protein IJE68_01775 [Clostridia bacterium]|nr:hypothetical protein [Clostridia bacterium]
MSIITFWNDSREQSGRTLTSVAVATRMAIERNSKILLISTSFGDSTMKNCFWGDTSKNTSFFSNGKNNNIAVENGIEGLYKLITSNKLTPSIITDYTKVVFKGRLEVITGFSEAKIRTTETSVEELRKIEASYIELIKTANQYYDIVIVDLDKRISRKTQEEILNLSQVNVFVLTQRLESINRYNELRKANAELTKTRCIPVIGKYMSNYKYNSKNIARYLGQKQELDLLPFNLLYMAAADEADVVDLFLKLKNVKDKTDENYIFMQCTLNLTNNIVKKLQDMQMKMR